MNPRRLLGFIFSLLISALFLALALGSVDFGKLAHAFAIADYPLVMLAAGFTLIGYFLRAARWRVLLSPAQKIPLPRVFPVLVVGFALNNLLPGRPGEFARAYSLGKREGISKMLTLGTVVVERVADGIALIAFLLFAFVAFSPLHLDLPPVVETIGIVAAILFGIALAGLIFLLRREELALALIRQFERWMPRGLVARFERMLQSFVLGLHALKSSRAAFDIALLSLGVWTMEWLSY
ncbi:MAG: flippase-like domain-containing protein, partial [Chloroflexi bacterium]|nr:flippase-like domain-containing protein [Chloroflexota bacterium]